MLIIGRSWSLFWEKFISCQSGHVERFNHSMNYLWYRDKQKTVVRLVLRYVRGISLIVMILFIFTACEGHSAVPLKNPNAKSASELLAGKSVIFSVDSGFYNEAFGLEMIVNEDVIEDASKR